MTLSLVFHSPFVNKRQKGNEKQVKVSLIDVGNVIGGVLILIGVGALCSLGAFLLRTPRPHQISLDRQEDDEERERCG